MTCKTNMKRAFIYEVRRFLGLAINPTTPSTLPNISTHPHKNFSGSVVTYDSYLTNNNCPATAELVRECQGHPVTILKLTPSNPIRLLHYSSE